MKFAIATFIAFFALFNGPRGLADGPTTPREWVHLAVDQLCGPKITPGPIAQRSIPGGRFLEEKQDERGGRLVRLTQRFLLPGGDELRVVRLQPGGQLRRFTVAIYKNVGGNLRPLILGMADGECRVRYGRRIVRKQPAPMTVLQQLEGDLQTVSWTETLETKWPEGHDAGGPRVALVDSGIAYDLPLYRNHLARDPDGKPLGFDYWDSDPWPYDADTSRSPFFPIRHGSAVASVLVREAPRSTLIPFRYPRPDMGRMEALIERAAKAGARILAMPLGSRKKDDWTAFEKAMRANPALLAIVSAGNDGRSIDKDLLWPALLELDNMIVVTSSDELGRLARGSNWGPKSVDIMLPAENVPVVDFRGVRGNASGSSYAVPRLAALAARLLTAEPKLTTEALKTRIFARTAPPRHEDKVVAVGWITDPSAD